MITRVGVWISIGKLAAAACGGVADLGVVIGIDPSVDCVALARVVSFGAMELSRVLDSPFAWAAAGFIIGLALGVSALSAWLLAIGFGAFLVNLKLHGPSQHWNEGWLFAAGPAFMMAWVFGFIVRGLVFTS